MPQKFKTFIEFYPYYLSEHSDRTCRRLHFIGTAGVAGTLAWTLATGTWWGLLVVPLVGYGFAWAGHFGFEKNKPATFRYPVYSLLGDFVMFRDMLTGRIRF
jgi:hypothetical protein